MADTGALEPDRWNAGLISRDSGQQTHVNLLSTLYLGLSALDWRLFRKLDKSELPVDPERLALLRTLVDTINAHKLQPRTIVGNALALRRFVRWADELNGKLSRTTIVPLMASYQDDTTHRLASLRRLLAEGLDLTDDERKLLFPPVALVENADDDWVFRLATGNSRRTADFLRLVVPGNAALPLSAFQKNRKAFQTQGEDDHCGRAELIRALRAEFKAWTISGSYTPSSQYAIFLCLREFVVWADDQKLVLDKEAAIKALVSYSQHLTGKWRAGALSDAAVHFKATLAVYILSGALDRQNFEIHGQLSLPPHMGSGWTSARPRQADIQRFCANLHSLVLALPSRLLCAPIHAPMRVELWSESESLRHDMPEPYGGYGDQGFDPRLANLPLTTLRIWAEMHRFIAITGCNLSAAQGLSVGDWRADGPRMVSMKMRANTVVSVQASRRYERHVAAHVEFLEQTWPLPIGDDTPLFPGVAFPRQARGAHSLVSGWRAKTNSPITVALVPSHPSRMRSWRKSQGLVLTSRQLRTAKAAWLLRRYSGDSLRVAQALGNTPEVAHGHYGGKGNLEQSIPEWSRHWASTESQAALAPGKCASPGRYEPVNDQESDYGSCNEGGCLGCRRYRGEESLDYIHRILSYRHCLCFRASSNSEVARLIDIIDLILDAYVEKYPDQRHTVYRFQSQISDRPHPRFAAMIRLLEIRHAT